MTIDATILQVESANFVETGAIEVGASCGGIAIKASASIADTLLAYYPLGSEVGKDKSGNGLDATLSGAQVTAIGVTGQGADDFSARRHHSYSVPALPALTNFSISCWVYPQFIPQEMSIFSIGDQFSFGLYYATPSVQIVRASVSIEPIRSSILADGRFYHLGMTWQENGEVSILVDGVVKKAEQIGYGPSVITPAAGKIGNFRDNQPLSALLSDLRIWTGIDGDQLAVEHDGDVANWVALAP